MCTFGAVNGTSKFPGTFAFNHGCKNGRRLAGCEKYEEYKEGCGNFRLEISSKPCTLLQGGCESSVMGDEKSKDAVRKRDLELARDAIKSGTLTRKFAQNLLGETPQNWTRWTAGEGGLFYDQFFCDYGKHVKIAIAIPNIMRRGNRVDYDVPTKELVRGLNLLIEGFTTSTIGPDGPFFQNGNRIARSCLWNGNTTDPPRELNQTFGYFGNVAAKQWSEASSSPTFSPSHVESYDWPWRINVTRLYEDDPYKYFSPIAY